jgi:outer membrane protein insertion porin family/translocation and assembly module TamA
VQVKPGVVLYPTRISYLVEPNRLLPEARLNVLFRQPAFPEARTNAFLRPEANVFPLLLRTTPGEDDSVLGYREFKSAVGLERVFYKVFVSAGHNVQVEDPFSYKGPLDADLRTLVISYPELSTRLSLVDNAVRPRKGMVLSNNLQVAGGPFGGDATDVKVQPEIRAYVPLGRRFTFASRATVGLLYPTGYGQVVQDKLQQPTTSSNRSERVRDIETVFFRGFFSGGSNSNRGFPIRAIAPHGVVPFLNPGTASQQVALNCNPSAENNFNPDPTLCSISIGGFSLWELSNELRFTVTGPISGAVFCDMSDVSPRTSNIRLTHLHLSCGAGGRYDTPVGPIRVDIGYRIQPAQVLGFPDEDKAVASDPSLGVQPKFEVFDLRIPIALAFGVGEAF